MDITVATWKASRFLVRQGSKGWMVYDRQRKAPALVGTKLAVNLTEEQASQFKLALMAGEEVRSPAARVGSPLSHTIFD